MRIWLPFHNRAIKQLITDEQAKRKGRLLLIEQLASGQENLEKLVNEISTIVNADAIIAPLGCLWGYKAEFY